MGEHEEQVALFDWAQRASGMHPELRGLYAIPNANKRSIGAAVYMKEEGLKAGVPDVCLPIARGGYIGLYIEMKFGKNKVTDNQIEWLTFLESFGHCVVVCRGFYQAKDVIEWYLDLWPDSHEPVPPGLSEWDDWKDAY